MLREYVCSCDQPVLHIARGLDAILDRVVDHLDRVGCAGLQVVQCAKMLKVDAVAGGNPMWNRTDAAQMRFESELVLFDPWDARPIEQRRLAIECPDEPPGLGGGIGENPGAWRNLVARRNVSAGAASNRQ